MNLRDYRSDLPFGDNELRAIRARVMQQIAREPRRAWMWLRVAFATAVIVLLVVRPVREAPIRVVESPSRQVVEARPPAPALHSETRRLEDSKTPHRPRRKKRSTPPPAIAAAPMRIEIQTSNPDIRILWITNSNPPGESR